MVEILLDFPADPRNALNALVRALEYDASFAIIAEQAQPHLDDIDLKKAAPMRFGSDDHIPAIKKEFGELGARFALTSMITRFEGFVWRLLHLRYIVEAISHHPGEFVRGPEYQNIRKKIQRETRKGISSTLTSEVVRQPSQDMIIALPWLEGLQRIRNCLMHRGGLVQLEDMEADSLTVPWVETRVFLNGQRIQLPHTGGGRLEVKSEMSTRSWKVGEMIKFSSADLQDVALTLSRLAQGIEREFETELTPLAKKFSISN
jgi:hypothetical protein